MSREYGYGGGGAPTPFEMETKARRVRDSAFWRKPVGTLLGGGASDAPVAGPVAGAGGAGGAAHASIARARAVESDRYGSKLRMIRGLLDDAERSLSDGDDAVAGSTLRQASSSLRSIDPDAAAALREQADRLHPLDDADEADRLRAARTEGSGDTAARLAAERTATADREFAKEREFRMPAYERPEVPDLPDFDF